MLSNDHQTLKIFNADAQMFLTEGKPFFNISHYLPGTNCKYHKMSYLIGLTNI